MLNIASQEINNITGPEDIQSIALTCRESLVELAKALVDDNPNLLQENNLKAADFKGIAKAVISIYAQGKSNRKLRKRCKSMAEIAWDNAAEMVHSSTKNIPDAKICLLFTCSIVSIFENLYLKYLGFDSEPQCPECRSLDYEFLTTDEDSIMILSCNSCGHKEKVKIQDDGVE